MSEVIAGFDGSQSRIRQKGKVDRIGFWIEGPKLNITRTHKLPRGNRTVDQVEMTALKHLCETLSHLGIKHAAIQGDSKRVIEKVLDSPSNGDSLLARCKEYFRDNPNWILYWVRREHNEWADIIAKNGIS
jgi:ribonuclease HI